LWDRPNYDCWEEHRDQIHTATLAAIYGGLKAVQSMELGLVSEDLVEDIRRTILDQCVSPEGTFVKSIGNPAVDGSLLWIAVPYGVVDVHDPRFMNTLAKIEHDIHYPNGGVYRYAADTYYGGGEWILLTAWLAWTYQQLGMPDKADSLMTWIGEQATPTGELPEQVSQHVLDPSYYPPWVEKWGLIACPLLWSHAMWLVVKCGSSSLPHTPGT
jgi:GH15 family glucan-1,4-alpha-glucosidase